MVVRYGYKPLFRSFDHLFDLAIGDYEGSSSYASANFKQKANEDGTVSYVMEMDLPGVKLEDLQVEFENGLISVSAERKTSNRSQSLSKSFSLQEKFDPESLQASLADGVLTLSVKELSQESKAKKITVTGG